MQYRFNGFTLDTDLRVIRTEDREVPLTPKALDLLMVLLESPGRVVMRQELLDRVWTGVAVSYEALSFQISEIRRALGDQADLIRTIPKSGYMWTGATPDVIDPTSIREKANSLAREDQASGLGVAAVSSAVPRAARKRSLLWGLPAILALLGTAGWLISKTFQKRLEWVESFTDDFERVQLGNNYRIADGEWRLNYGGLQGGGDGSSAIEILYQWSGDVRIEFDATVLSGSAKREVAVFLGRAGDDDPDSYYFGWGVDHEVAGIDRKGVEIALMPAPAIQLDRPYRISVMRVSNQLVMSVDDENVVYAIDPIPLPDTELAGVWIGTFDGFLRIDNLSISRRRVPRALDPTARGDVLFERGELSAAIDEYEKVARDHAGEPVAGEALFKVAQSLLSQNRCAEATDAFRRVGGSNAGSFHKVLARAGVARSLAAIGELDGAFRYLAAVEKQVDDPNERYALAGELLGLASDCAAAGRHARAAEMRRYIADRFPTAPLLRERAASLVALYGPSDRSRLEVLDSFLETSDRRGKPRYAVLRCAAILHLFAGDVGAATAAFRQIEEEYRETNLRFSITSAWEQALLFSAAERAVEAEEAIRRVRAARAIEEYARGLESHWAAFSMWKKGDMNGAMNAMRSLISAGGGAATIAMARMELAQLGIEAGMREEAEGILKELAESDDTETAITARLFLGAVSPAEYRLDPRVPDVRRLLHLGRYFEIRGERGEAADVYRQYGAAETDLLTPALCRAWLARDRAD